MSLLETPFCFHPDHCGLHIRSAECLDPYQTEEQGKALMDDGDTSFQYGHNVAHPSAEGNILLPLVRVDGQPDGRSVRKKYASQPEASRASYQRNKDVAGDRELRRKGLTSEKFLEIARSQDFVCAICGRFAIPKEGSDWRELSIDHDHTCCPSGKKQCGKCVRGLLCDKCNQMLGMAGDSIELLLEAVAYLSRWKEKKCQTV